MHITDIEQDNQNTNVNNQNASQPLNKSAKTEEESILTVNLKSLRKPKKLTSRVSSKSQLEAGWNGSFLDHNEGKQAAVQQKNKRSLARMTLKQHQDHETGIYTDGIQVKKA